MKNRPDTSTDVEHEHDRKGQFVAAEVTYLLPDSVFGKLEIVFGQIADDAFALLLDHLCVKHDQVSVNLHDIDWFFFLTEAPITGTCQKKRRAQYQ